jgi:hypothetical protein
MLARRLAGRGVVLSGGTLAAVLAHHAASACVPPAVVSSTIQAAAVLAAGRGATAGAISAKVVALTDGVLKTMVLTKLKLATAAVLMASVVGAGGLLSYHALAAEPARARGRTEPQEPTAHRLATGNEEVQKVLDRYRAARPGAKDLAIFRLDWTPTLKDAKARAAKEQRPILLIVVTNSFGNMHSGHC